MYRLCTFVKVLMLFSVLVPLSSVLYANEIKYDVALALEALKIENMGNEPSTEVIEGLHHILRPAYKAMEKTIKSGLPKLMVLDEINQSFIKSGVVFGEQYFLSDGLIPTKDKQGKLKYNLDCDTISALYYFLLKMANIDAFIVDLPKHQLIYVRDGEMNALWETTSADASQDPDAYKFIAEKNIEQLLSTSTEDLLNFFKINIGYRSVKTDCSTSCQIFNDLSESAKDKYYFDQILTGQGQAFSFMGDFNNALKVLKQAEKLNPDSFETVIMMAMANSMAGNYDVAEMYAKKALSLSRDDDDTIEAYNDLGLIYTEANDFSKAISILEKSLQMKDNQEAFERLTYVYYKQNRSDIGLPMAHKCITRYPTSSICQKVIGFYNQ